MNPFFFSWFLLSFFIPGQQTGGPPQTMDCKIRPPFISQLTNMDPSKVAVSTTEIRDPGLVVVELENPRNPNSKRTQIYKHESWKMTGNTGPFAIDHKGNIYVVPAPKINVLDNPIKDQNTLYTVNANTGIMTTLISLPHEGISDKYNPQNPYGLIGIHFDCQDLSLYASSLFGSLPEKENGMIFHIDPYNKTILSTRKGIDAFGIIPYQFGPEKRLLYGSARTGDVYSILLVNGIFTGLPRKEFTLEGLGVRGDDKVRRFRILQNGDLKVYGLQFYYNLTAPTEKPESEYVFRYDEQAKKWKQVEN